MAKHGKRYRAASGTVEIETTRPELIPSVVALVAHPDDAPLLLELARAHIARGQGF